MLVSLNQLGSLVIDIDNNRLDFVFLRTNALAGDYFTIIKSVPPTSPPLAPSALSATAVSSSAINLAWDDNSTDEDGFKIERSTDGIDFAQFAVVGANIAGGMDSSLNPSTTYYYRVRAFNAAGDSPYSNIAQATTLAGPLVATLIASNSVWKYLDTGVNQGTAWRSPSFNDTAWAAGAAELGYGDGGEATVVSFGPNSSAKYITTYFRKSFSVADPAAYTNLLLRLVRDDGAVVYVNGVEVFRSNLPSGTIAFNTLAPTAIANADESTYLSANISPVNLVAGNNVVAVEMHQNAGNSSDISFNLQLIATGPGTSSGDTSAPAAITDFAVNSFTSSSVTLGWTTPGDDGNTGTATSYDVRYSTSPITEANWATATSASGEPAPASAGTAEIFTVTGLATGTAYYFGIKTADEMGNVSPLSNIPGATTTQVPPAAPSALAATAVSSSEIALGWIDNANNENGFHVERSTNGIDFVALGSVGPNVTGASDISAQPSMTYHYRVRAFNAAGASTDSNVAQTTTPGATVATNVVLVASNALWKYLDTGVDQGTAWRAPAFDDSAWAAGAAELGYGDGGEATIVSFGPNSANKYITTYFRKSFTVADASGFTNLLLQLQRDDGAIVYLNGIEVYRNNLPAGAVTFSTLAPVAIGGADEAIYQSANLSSAALVSGVNVIAIEMHQANGTSSDLSFNLQLTAQGAVAILPDTNAPAVTTDLVAGNATPNSITLAWTAPGDDGNTGTASGYDVRFSVASITEASWDSATPILEEQTPGAVGT
ncbi:MAG TPA: fibronectin type III domain-containing protein, partial [Methylomirabilota bacterium]|nr:fibronectin type III domain-containing protein [Methylomirabilota bacterium]